MDRKLPCCQPSNIQYPRQATRSCLQFSPPTSGESHPGGKSSSFFPFAVLPCCDSEQHDFNRQLSRDTNTSTVRRREIAANKEQTAKREPTNAAPREPEKTAVMAQPVLVNGANVSQADQAAYARDNLQAWDNIANEWETFHTPGEDDGSDMFTQCLLPVVWELATETKTTDDLAAWKEGETVLDLGAGSGIIARMFAKKGAHVTGLDFSEAMLEKGRERSKRETLKGKIEYGKIDLMNYDEMAAYMENKERFDIITISTTLKSLPSLDPVAKALPLMLKPGGRVVAVDLHPAFSKPAGHRGMEIYEDPNTGKQQLSTYIKIPKYLNVPPSKSEAVRGQPEPLWVFHRPFWSLMEPFFKNGLVLDAMREPAFEGAPQPQQAQSYHNFQQTPMLLAFRLRHKDQINGARN